MEAPTRERGQFSRMSLAYASGSHSERESPSALTPTLSRREREPCPASLDRPNRIRPVLHILRAHRPVRLQTGVVVAALLQVGEVLLARNERAVAELHASRRRIAVFAGDLR